MFPFSYLFSICFTSAPKEQEYKENVFQEPPKVSQRVKVYSRKTTPQYPKHSQWIPKRGIMKPKQAAPSKNCKTILGGKLASFESMCWTPRIKAPVQHIPVSCSIFPSSDLYMSGFLLGKIMLYINVNHQCTIQLWPIYYFLKIPWIIFRAFFHCCYSCAYSTTVWALLLLFFWACIRF